MSRWPWAEKKPGAVETLQFEGIVDSEENLVPQGCAPRLDLSLAALSVSASDTPATGWVAPPLPDRLVFGTATANSCCGGTSPPDAVRASWWCC